MRTHDLVVIGAGSGNMVVDDRFADLDVAIIDDGAQIIGAQAASLIQIFVVAMNFGVPAQELARQPYWIHPALSETVENALLNLQESA